MIGGGENVVRGREKGLGKETLSRSLTGKLRDTIGKEQGGKDARVRRAYRTQKP